jgi:hypothetical protein
MQNDTSKEGNDANATIICLHTKGQTKLSPGKINGRRPKQRLQRGEVRCEKHTCCQTEETGPSFCRPQNQLYAANRQSIEGVKRWKDSKQLLMATMKSFCRKGSQERPQLPRGGRSSPASQLPIICASSNTQRRRKVGIEAIEADVKCRHPEAPRGERDPPSHPSSEDDDKLQKSE